MNHTIPQHQYEVPLLPVAFLAVPSTMTTRKEVYTSLRRNQTRSAEIVALIIEGGNFAVAECVMKG